MKIKQQWLDLFKEEIIEPERPIIDPHHHLWRQRNLFPSYLLDSWNADTNSGHNIEQSVFMECGAEYFTEGNHVLRPVGETVFVAKLAEIANKNTSNTKIAAIVGHADMTLGKEIEDVLEQHMEVANGLFRGIRHHCVWDQSQEVPKSRINPPKDLLMKASFREALSCLAKKNLSFDAWLYHPQLPQLIDVARACPETSIILNHLGTPLGVGPYAHKHKEVFAEWQRNMSELSSCPNVSVKLGGLAMGANGFFWEDKPKPPSSDEIVNSQKAYHMHAIDCFGVERCMFESNFPIEKVSVSYPIIWNAFKKLVSDFSEAEKHALFKGTAASKYRIDT